MLNIYEGLKVMYSLTYINNYLLDTRERTEMNDDRVMHRDSYSEFLLNHCDIAVKDDKPHAFRHRD